MPTLVSRLVRRSIAALSGVLLALTGAGALAQPAPEPGPGEVPAAEERTPYQRHFTNGVKLFKEARDYHGALAEFQAAYDAEPQASPLVNQALCYKALKRYDRAIEVLERALSLHRDTMKPTHIDQVERELSELRALLAYVMVRLEPAEARLTVDGEARDGPREGGVTQVVLSPGTHRFEAALEGYRSQAVELVIASGEREEPVVLTLERETEDGPRIENPPDVPPEDEEDPTRRGLFGYGGGALLVVGGTHPVGFTPDQGTPQIGAAGSLHVGYRVTDYAGFEGMGQLSDVRVDGQLNVAGEDIAVQYKIRSIRLGAMLRLMAPPRTKVRFAMSLGGGIMIEDLEWKQKTASADGTPIAQLDPRYADTGGVGGFGYLEAGVELEFSNILIDVAVQNSLQSTKGLDTEAGANAWDTNPLLFVGPAVRIGYGLW